MWRRSARCGTGNCVEVATVGDTVLIRDSKDPSAGSITCTAGQWAGFLSAIRSGVFGPAGDRPLS